MNQRRPSTQWCSFVVNMRARHLLVLGLTFGAVAGCSTNESEATTLLCQDALERRQAVEGALMGTVRLGSVDSPIRRVVGYEAEVARLDASLALIETDINRYCFEAAGIATPTPSATPVPPSASDPIGEILRRAFSATPTPLTSS